MVPIAKREALGIHRGTRCFFQFGNRTDGNRVLCPQNKVLPQMCITVLKCEHPRESWMKFLEAHKAQGQLSCLQKGFTRSSTLNQLPTAQPGQLKIPNSTKCKSRISWHNKCTLIMTMRMKDVIFLQIQSRTACFSVVTSFREALKMPQMQSPEKSMRVFMQVAVYQSIITFINSFHSLFPSIGTSLKVRSDQDRLIGTRKFSVWRLYD